jgi:hypothetical protein
VFWAPVCLLLLVLAAGLIARTGGGTASPVLARQVDASSPLPVLPRPIPLPAAPGAIDAIPKPPPAVRKAPPVTAVRPAAPIEIPAAPSMVTAPIQPQPAAPPVVQAPVVPVPVAPPPPAAPPVLGAVSRPMPPAPTVLGAPVAPPKPAPSVMGGPQWTETEIEQESPVVRIYNHSSDDGRSLVFLRNGRERYRIVIRRPYGEVILPAGEYRYELYFSGSWAAPNPDQVGVLRCRKHRRYSLELFDTPFARTRRDDLGDMP